MFNVSLTGVQQVVVNGGYEGDRIEMKPGSAVRVRFNGGLGGDSLIGGDGSDDCTARPATT